MLFVENAANVLDVSRTSCVSSSHLVGELVADAVDGEYVARLNGIDFQFAA
jgi:hypothetical protein